ncbi:MAG: transposase family protein [Streptosporangiaceae bacterium]
MRLACPEAGCSQGACPVHDATEKRWRHRDLFEHQAFLSARVPRVTCPGTAGTSSPGRGPGQARVHPPHGDGDADLCRPDARRSSGTHDPRA